MLPKEILKKIRRIEITTSRVVSDIFAGQYQSVFKGKGMEFEEVREYLPGDEIRSIDWNVTARMGHPYVKKFVEERELTVMLVLDMSASCMFGTVKQLKSQLAAELCSVLAFSAIKNNDRVGLIAFTDRIEKFIPPRKGLSHVLRVIREALYFKARGKGTDIPQALEYLNRVTARKTVCFVISDFYPGPAVSGGLKGPGTVDYAPDFKRALSVANKRHDVVAVTINDPREFALADIGIVRLYDPETMAEFLVDTSDQRVRDEYRENSARHLKGRALMFRSVGVDNIDIRTDVPYTRSIYAFFRSRERRRR